jgi:hypothetical protein
MIRLVYVLWLCFFVIFSWSSTDSLINARFENENQPFVASGDGVDSPAPLRALNELSAHGRPSKIPGKHQPPAKKGNNEKPNKNKNKHKKKNGGKKKPPKSKKKPPKKKPPTKPPKNIPKPKKPPSPSSPPSVKAKFSNKYQPQILISMIGFGSDTTAMDKASWPFVATNVDGFWLNAASTNSSSVNSLIGAATRKRGIAIYSIGNSKVSSARIRSVKDAHPDFDAFASVFVRQGLGSGMTNLTKDEEKFTFWTEAEIRGGLAWAKKHSVIKWLVAMRQNAFPQAEPSPPLDTILPRGDGGVFELPPDTVMTEKIFSGDEPSINRFIRYFQKSKKDQISVWLAPVNSAGTNYLDDAIKSLEILKKSDVVPDVIALANYGSTKLVWGPESDAKSWTYATMELLKWRNLHFPESEYPRAY